MRKKLLSGLFWVLLANLLVKPLWILGIEVGVQNAVGAEAYGFYFAVMNLAYIFNILLDMGVTNFNTRNIARNSQLIRKHLSGILTIKLALLALYLVVTFTVGLLIGYDSRQFYLLAWICLNQFLNSLIVYLRSNFEGLLMFKTDSVLSVLDRVLMIVICGLLLWGPGRPAVFRIEWFVYAQTAAYLVAAAVAVVALARKTGLHRLTWNRPFSLVILKKSLPFALLVLLMASYNRIDPVLLERLLPARGDYEAGIYAAAFRLLDALTMIAYLVSVPLLPVYAKLTKAVQQEEESFSPCQDMPRRGKRGATSHGSSLVPAGSRPRHRAAREPIGPAGSELRAITRMVFSLMFVTTVSIALTCGAFGTDLMGLLYRAHVGEIAQVFRILIFGFIPIGFTYIFGTLLTANGSLKQLNLFAAISLCLNVAVNLICIPRWGAAGAALASLTAQTFIGVAQMILACRIFHFRLSGGYLLRLVAFAAVMMASAWLLSSFRSAFSPMWQQGIVLVSVLALVAIVSALLLRLIDLKEMKTIWKEKEDAAD